MIKSLILIQILPRSLKKIMNQNKKSYRPDGCRVTVRNHQGNIQLRYTYNFSREEINLGISWAYKKNHKIAEAIAREISNDIYIFDRYDITKDKYRLNSIKPIETKFAIYDCWEYYKERKELSQSQLVNRIKPIDKIFTLNPDFKRLSPQNLEPLTKLILDKYSTSTAKSLLLGLSGAITLCQKHKKITGENYLTPVISSLTLVKTMIGFYSTKDIQKILDTFHHASNHSYYYNFVKFRCLTGTRPSEAIALTWQDIIDKDDRQYIRINKRYVLNKLQSGTKNKTSQRLFPINDELGNLLNSITKTESKLIFPSPMGTYIDNHNFDSRHWKPVINFLYEHNQISQKLSFYSLRHYFCNQIVRSGIDLNTVSALVGNSVEVLIKNYLTANQEIEIPDIL